MGSGLMWSFIILQVAAVVAIMFFIRMLLHKQLTAGMKRIQNVDQANLKKESDLGEKEVRLEETYRAKMAQAQQQAQAIVAAAKEDIKAMQEEERVKSKEESKKVIANALREKEKMLKDAEYETVNKAIDFSKKILKELFSDDEVRALRYSSVKSLLQKLISSRQVAELIENSSQIEIITTDAVSDADKKHISEFIEGKTKEDTELIFSVDTDVLGGLILKIGEQIVDSSIAYRVSKIAATLREELT